MLYKPVTYSNCDLKLPEMNWQVSVSVDVFNFGDQTPYKVFWQMEPEEIIPQVEKLIRNHQFYDLILTWNHEVLSQCKNAVFMAPGSVWVQEADTSQKQFAASCLMSSKNDCAGHKFRLETFAKLPAVVGTHLASAHELPDEAKSLLATYGVLPPAAGVLTDLRSMPITKHKSPPYLPSKLPFLKPFQFTVVMENATRPNYFTEKLLDAFATKTIPIYWGCPNVGDFFNIEGILRFGEIYAKDGYKGYIGPVDILNHLQTNFYESRHAAIEENYQKALTYADRTGNLVRAIEASWIPKLGPLHSGEPNVQ